MTRETAIALLNNLRAFSEDDDEPAIDMAIKVLKQKTEWIPVSERLPKEGIVVLTYDINKEIEFGEYQNGKWYWLAESCTDYWAKNNGVVAWMPLPEPYKGDGKE